MLWNYTYSSVLDI